MIGEQPEKEEQPEREVPRKKTQEVEVAAGAGFLRFKIRPLFLFYNKTGSLVTGEAVCG